MMMMKMIMMMINMMMRLKILMFVLTRVQIFEFFTSNFIH